MDKKYILVSMEDERIKHLSDVLGNKTSKKIIDLLAEKDSLSEKDISDELNLPINTVEYNLNKLIKAELIEKSKTFFWSQKGKKIPTYKLSNKSIIISPKSKISSKIKSVLPVAILAGIGTLALKYFYQIKSSASQINYQIQDSLAETASKSASISLDNSGAIFNSGFPVWNWFLFGAFFAILIFIILNWRKF